MLKLDLNENINGKENYARQKDYDEAKGNISHYFEINPQNIVVTNGSFHGLQLISTFLLGEKDTLLIHTPNFVFYLPFEKYKKIKVKKIKFDKKNFLKNVTQKLKGGVKIFYLANPNNPMGYNLSKEDLLQIIKLANEKNIKIIIDEAYFEFNGVTVKDLVDKFYNLYVLRTFSKAFGLAGIRMGCIISNKENVGKLEEVKGPPYIIGRTGLRKLASLKESDFIRTQKYAEQIKTSREIFQDFLKENHIEHFPSSANFVTFKVTNSLRFIKFMKKRGVLISDLSDYPDSNNLLKNYVRLTLPPVTKIKDVIKIIKDYFDLNI